MKCHSTAGHEPAEPRGVYGALCDACYGALVAWFAARRRTVHHAWSCS